MKVSGIAIDPFTNTPIIILKDINGDQMLPIWIGFMEASSIAMELEKTPRVRPLTHDLLKNILDDLQYSVSRVELT
ncbi:MAG: bifunctional nuclease family protein, partial [Candidatus Dadabacteria bacterium]|nr:bifunctional nuclease family protein [Candidatus Dadabacteria bacterium]